jgi:uridine kinase
VFCILQKSLRELANLPGKLIYFLIAISVIKFLLAVTFSSGFQMEEFYPFVLGYIESGNNPWETMKLDGSAYDFPFPALMLYILSIFYYPISLFNIENPLLMNCFSALPLLVSDAIIYFCILKHVSWGKVDALVAYTISPIIIFSTYMHHQLDIIPTSIMLLAVTAVVRKKIGLAAIFFAAACSIKFHIIALFPLLILYILKRRQHALAVKFILYCLVVFLIINFQFLGSDKFIFSAILNDRASTLFDIVLQGNGGGIYVGVFIILMLHIFAFANRRISTIVLLANITVLYCALMILVPASPGWFVWVLPLIAILISKSNGYERLWWVYGLLNILYIMYFTLVHRYSTPPLVYLGQIPLDMNINNEVIANVIYTSLQAVLLAIIYYVFKTAKDDNDRLFSNNVFTVGVSGDSGTGKTRTLRLLGDLFCREIHLFEGDGDHRWERGHAAWSSVTHLHPKANWLYSQSSDIIKLKQGQPVKRREYDHCSGQFTKGKWYKPRSIVAFAGLHTLYLPEGRRNLDLKIYMKPVEQLRVKWKVDRDTQKRGYTEKEILEQIKERKSDYDTYIAPQEAHADLSLTLVDVSLTDLLLIAKMNASVDIEPLSISLGGRVKSTYDQTLTSQTVEFSGNFQGVHWPSIAASIVTEFDEITYLPKFNDGVDGLLQILLLIVISSKLEVKNA